MSTTLQSGTPDGSSSATACTPSRNVVGVAAYASAGFDRLPDVIDFRRSS